MQIEGYAITVDGRWIQDTFATREELACRRLFLNAHVPGRPIPTVNDLREAWKLAEVRGFQCAKATLTIREAE